MTDSERREQLYDAYLDRLLAGVEIDPATFLQRENCKDSELLEKLQALHLVARLVPAESPPESTPEPGLPCTQIGDYRLLRCLGRGGMGEVYLAEQESLDRKVAVKILRASAFQSATASLRFHREARSLARLRHPNVVTVFDFGVENGQHFLVMEYVPGQDLTEIIADTATRQETIPPSKAVTWAAQIARALQSAHEIGIFHRDVKASNIRITPEGRAVLVDFGLASEHDAEGPTLTHSFVGSPAYASPEQIRGNVELDARSDVYSLGVTLYRCITGRLPFEAAELDALFHKILNEQAVSPRSYCPGIPQDLDVVIRHSMEKDPERRYQSAAAFADDLEALLEFRPIQARPPAFLRRCLFWARSHRASAAAIFTASIAVLAIVALLGVQSFQRSQNRLARAEELLERARDRFDEFRAIRDEIGADTQRVLYIRATMESNYLPPQQLQELDRIEDAVQEAELQRERLFNGVLDLLDQAEASNADLKGPDALRAELYMARHLESEMLGDAVGSRFYRAQANRFGASQNLEELQLTAHLFLEVTPPGPVQVQEFVFLEQAQLREGGDHRMVPIARAGAVEGVLPGTWCLRVDTNTPPFLRDDLIVSVESWPIEGSVLVTRGNGRIQAGDRLTAVDDLPIASRYDIDQLMWGPDTTSVFHFQSPTTEYQIPASSLAELDISLGIAQDYLESLGGKVGVVRNGQVLKLSSPAGVKTRVTTIPLLAPAHAWHTVANPQQAIGFPPGAALLRIRRDGFEDQVLSLRLQPDQKLHAKVTLIPRDTTPPGFRRVIPQPSWSEEPFWIQEREVTSAEYLAFLNAPEIQTQINASAEAILFPRTFRNAQQGGSWLRNADGLFVLPEDWPATWPVMGISWFDAVRYAEWLSVQARAAGLPYQYRLPSLAEFRIAARGAANWDYPYGPRFRPNWSNCCFSRPTPAPEPVLSYPVDESVFGVFDTSGSALEWLDAWWDQNQTERFAAGGSWAQGGSIPAKPTSGLGIRPRETSLETSFRLVLEIDGF